MAIGTIGAIIGGSIIGGGLSYAASRKASKEASSAAQAATDAQERMYLQTREDFAPQRQLGYNALDRLSRLYGYRSAPAAATTQRLPFDDFVASRGGVRTFTQRGGVNGTLQGLTEARRAYQTYLNTPTPASATQSGAPDLSAFFESPDYQFNLAEGQKAIDRSAAARSGLLSGRAVLEGQRYASGLASREFAGFVDRLMQQAGLGSTGIGATAAAGQNAANNISAIAQNAGNARASAYAQGAAGVNNAIQGGIQNYLLMRYLSPGQG